MKYRLEGTTFEAIDTYVRITLGSGKVQVTGRQCPTVIDVVTMLRQMQGYTPNRAQLLVCSRASDDARNNRLEMAL